MKKLLVILLLLFPVHGAWAKQKCEDGSYYANELKLVYAIAKNECKKGDKARCKYAKRIAKCHKKNKAELDKKLKAETKDFCARSSGEAKTNKAANRIYKACMERNGY